MIYDLMCTNSLNSDVISMDEHLYIWYRNIAIIKQLLKNIRIYLNTRFRLVLK